MKPAKVKICGLTQKADAELAVELGADALGFIFVDSPRRLSPKAAREISRDLPTHVLRIGVFTQATVNEILDSVHVARLTGVQLHGGETPEFVRRLKYQANDLYVIKVIEPDSNDFNFDSCDAAMIDSRRSRRPVYEVASLMAIAIAIKQPFFVAGCLNSGNVSSAVQILRPYGVDVSSGVESAPGIKDPVKLRNFFAAMNGRYP